MNKTNLKDHREIGRDLDLFSFHEYAPGAVFWHHKGWIIYRILEEFIREKDQQGDYQEISTPVMVKNQLFKESGHWEHFGEHNMFNLAIYEEEEEKRFLENSKLAEKEGRIKVYKIDGTPMIFPQANYSLKPMNCPEAALVFRSKTRSYQDLPIRLSEFGILHRRELSGVLGGLLRVRQFVIDDAHLFVRPDQIQGEIHKLLLLVIEVYQSLGFKPKFYLATRPDKAMGDVKTWKLAEEDLESALKKAKVNFNLKPKDGAFYGPKIDIHINDSQDRDWQLATIQLDFQIPQRMSLDFVNNKGEKERPVMIHRGIFGSLERFIGILTEHFQGAFPVWLSPVQTIILPISGKFKDYANKIYRDLKSSGIRVELNERNETLQAKIRDATLQKIPYLLIVGEKEESSGKIAVRTRGSQDLGQMTIEKFADKIHKDIDNKL
ncbi:threonine--tRNA ligase [Candidatus Curtissbacteria bacterium RIFOXYC2_FULL_41_11]|nr:MAG: threonine--tRNA ligase [Candidatus Curtissbacteria bacterium RIFOXYC2_FULL_41_11]